MSYKRVLPRDAFNEANLLKCIGKLTMLVEDGAAPGWTFAYDGAPFEILQDPGDGALHVANILFFFKGDSLRVYRPLNSRDPWPLFAESEVIEAFSIFNGTGELQTV